jgi:hypothetical protein
MTAALAIPALAAWVGLAGCEEDSHSHGESGDEHDHGSETPGAEACEHMELGPSEAKTAAVKGKGAAPDITLDHTRWDLALTADETNVVTYTIEAEGELEIAISNALTVRLVDDSGAAVELEPVESPCELVASIFHAPVAVGTYTLEIDAGSATAVQIVFEELAE